MSISLADAGLDLIFGSSCLVCQRPGRQCCAQCRSVLPAGARWVRPDPTPPGLLPTTAAGNYDGALQELLLHYKEHGRWGLRTVLGGLLATSVAAHQVAGPMLLVPVPSRAATVRSRGYDTTSALCRVAARALGRRARVAPLVRLRRRVDDQAGLSGPQRWENLQEALWVPSQAVRRWAGAQAEVIICDDIMTSGATARDAQRALRAVGVPTAGVAVIAATPRRASN